jgi:protein-arginine kinase activator protein McsA
MENVLLIFGNEKQNYNYDKLYIENDNVYFTEANVFKLKGNIYSIDDTCKVNRNDIVDAINNGDDVVIKIDSSFLVAVIIRKSLESKLKEELKLAIDNEDYELAKIINDKIKNKNYENINSKITI